MTKTAVYCAYQHPKYLYLALISALEFHHHNSDIDVYILTDMDILPYHAFSAQNITLINTNAQLTLGEEKQKTVKGFSVHGKFNNRQIKLQTYAFIPQKYDIYLFIDADILPLASCDDLWNSMSTAQEHIAFGLETADTLGKWAYYNDTEEGAYTQKICPADTISYNSGVFVYTQKAIQDGFFDTWVSEWKRFRTLDQLALARTISTLSYPVMTLHERYNYCPSKINSRTPFEPQIVFLHLRKWIIPHTSLPALYEKHAQFALSILDTHIARDTYMHCIAHK